MKPTFSTATLSPRRLYTPDVVELKLSDIAGRFVTIIDRKDIKEPIDIIFQTMPNREYTYRGWPYTEQVENALKDPESTGVLVTVTDSIEVFKDRHFNEHGDQYQTLCRKYRKPIILHMVSETGCADIIESYSDVFLQRAEVYGITQVECVKNRLEVRARMS